MSVNPETRAWWSEDHHHQQQQQQQQGILMETIQNSWLNTRRFNLNQDEEEGDDGEQGSSSCHVDSNGIGRWSSCSGEDEKEAMFEKPLTPSDVGKLNRLVIPKQHAEKYFPLAAADNSSGGVGDNKGHLLSFEDESGKYWRFRYSYWNSSQSYVLTKGWSRYIKDKRLDAGDVVSFLRHRTHSHRLYITWRRRHLHPPSAQSSRAVAVPNDESNNCNNSRSNSKGVSLGWTTTGFYPAHPYPTHHHTSPFQSHSLHAGSGTPSKKQSSKSKVLRLFGVNMECQPEPDESGPSRPEYMSSSSSSNPHQQYLYQYHHHRPQASCASNPHHHMDVKQMRNRPG